MQVEVGPLEMQKAFLWWYHLDARGKANFRLTQTCHACGGPRSQSLRADISFLPAALQCRLS